MSETLNVENEPCQLDEVLTDRPESPSPLPASVFFARHRWRLLAFVLIAVVYFAVPNARPDFTRFNSHDGESYLALAYGMIHDLGYTRSMVPGQYVPHRLWPPGMPLILAPAVFLSGETIDWRLVKATMIVIGLVGVLAAWGLVRQITGRETAADLTALILALNPFYWHFSHIAMVGLPSLVWVLLSLILTDRVFARRTPSYTMSAAAGLFCGLAMLIRGTLGGLILIPIAYWWGERAMTLPWSGKLRVSIVFALVFFVPFAGWSVRNTAITAEGLDGVNHVRSLLQENVLDKRMLSPTEVVARVIENISQHVIYRPVQQLLPGGWVPAALDWKGSGHLALLATIAVGIACLPWRGLLGTHFVILFMLVLLLPFSVGGEPRYWFPVLALAVMTLGLTWGGRLQYQWRPQHRWWVGALIGILLLNLAAYVFEHEQAPYNPRGPYQELAGLFAKVREVAPTVKSTLTPNPHAFRLITGLDAPMPYREHDPVYDHVVVRIDDVEGWRPPVEILDRSHEVVKVYPWALVALEEPHPLSALVKGKDPDIVGASTVGASTRNTLSDDSEEKKRTAEGMVLGETLGELPRVADGTESR